LSFVESEWVSTEGDTTLKVEVTPTQTQGR